MKKIIQKPLFLITILSISLIIVGCTSRRSQSQSVESSSDITESNTTLDETENATTTNQITDKYIIEFEDGGRDYVYIYNGIEHHTLVPPEGFDPITATDEELERYCFPPRPTDKAQLKQWEKQMKNYKSTPIPEEFLFETNKEEDVEAPIVNADLINFNTCCYYNYDRTPGGLHTWEFVDEEIKCVSKCEPYISSCPIDKFTSYYGLKMDAKDIANALCSAFCDYFSETFSYEMADTLYFFKKNDAVSDQYSITFNSDNYRIIISFKVNTNIYGNIGLCYSVSRTIDFSNCKKSYINGLEYDVLEIVYSGDYELVCGYEYEYKNNDTTISIDGTTSYESLNIEQMTEISEIVREIIK